MYDENYEYVSPKHGRETTADKIITALRVYKPMCQALLDLGVKVVERGFVKPEEWAAWLHDTEMQTSDRNIHLASPNEFMAQAVRNKFLGHIAKVTGKNVSVSVAS